MAGLAAARHLQTAGRTVLVIDSNDEPGGRVRSHRIDGLTLDLGFQLLNPAYPEAQHMLDLRALQLRPFTPGVRVRTSSGTHTVVDPFRAPNTIATTVASIPGTRWQQARFGAYAASLAVGTGARLQHRTDGTAEGALQGFGDITSQILRPFLSGVLFDDSLTTSRRLVDVFMRSFIRGTPAVPALGMGAIATQLSTGVALSLNETVRLVTPTSVTTDQRIINARAVLVASDPLTAARLIPELRVPVMRSGTTWWHRAPLPIEAINNGMPILTVDPERRGPLVNTVVMNAAAPEYAPDGFSLIASTAIGTADHSPADISRHLDYLYEMDTSRWEVVAVQQIAQTVPVFPVGTPFRKPTQVSSGVFVAGDHRDTPSIQGALVSGRRAAAAIQHRLA